VRLVLARPVVPLAPHRSGSNSRLAPVRSVGARRCDCGHNGGRSVLAAAVLADFPDLEQLFLLRLVAKQADVHRLLFDGRLERLIRLALNEFGLGNAVGAGKAELTFGLAFGDQVAGDSSSLEVFTFEFIRRSCASGICNIVRGRMRSRISGASLSLSFSIARRPAHALPSIVARRSAIGFGGGAAGVIPLYGIAVLRSPAAAGVAGLAGAASPPWAASIAAMFGNAPVASKPHQRVPLARRQLTPAHIQSYRAASSCDIASIGARSVLAPARMFASFARRPWGQEHERLIAIAGDGRLTNATHVTLLPGLASSRAAAASCETASIEEALSDCNQAIQLDPKNAPTRFGYQ